MTAVAELLAAGRAAGFVFHLEAGHVRCRAPGTPEAAAMLDALRARRAELVAALTGEAAGETAVPAVPILTGPLAAAAIARALAPNGRGGIVIASRVLSGQPILLVRDETALVPEKYQHLVRFTRAELEQIGRDRWSAERLRAVVLVKEDLRTGQHPEDQVRLVPVDEAGALHGTIVPAREWLERDVPRLAGPTLEDLCEERQPWLWHGLPGRSPEET